MNLLRKKKPTETTVERDVLRAALSMRKAARGAHQHVLEALDKAGAYVGTIEADREAAEARTAAAMTQRSEALTNALKTGIDPRLVEAGTDNPVPGIERQHALAQRARDALQDELDTAEAVVKSAETKTRHAIAEVMRTESKEVLQRFIEADALAAQLRTQLAGLKALGDQFLGVPSIAFEAVGALHQTNQRYPDQRGIVEAAQQWRAHAARLEADAEDRFNP